MTRIYESDVEELAIALLESIGYTYLSPEEQEVERKDLADVVLQDRLVAAIDRLNPQASEQAKEQAVKQVLRLPSLGLVENNEAFHKMLTEGIDVEVYEAGEAKGSKIWLVDFEHPTNNEFIVCNQFTVTHENTTKRPDVVLLVNGLPLVVIELKNPTDEQATVKKAFTQLQNYKTSIPPLFHYNGVLVASDGLDARAGALTSSYSRFLAWKTIDGTKEEKATVPEIETLIKGMLSPRVLLDLIAHFTAFQKMDIPDLETGLTQIQTIKVQAAYHQYHAVNKAVVSTKRAAGDVGDQKVGVVWHTQGSGKSLSMVFYAGKIVRSLDNPTVVVITDRNDLDDQLFDTFASCKQLLRQDPVQAIDRDHLKNLLKTNGGGIIFTTIQKFSPADGSTNFDQLSARKNIVVIADEAHRSQYGFGAKTTMKDGEATTKYGFAKYLRDALPHASFIGFTGTPIEKEDASTPAVFGDYIDVYDIQQAVEDGATVRIYYESRLAKVHLKPEEAKALDAEVEAITEGEESTAKEKAKAKWTQLEAIVGHKDRLRTVAKDIVEHFEKRQEVFDGKGLIVTMSRRIAVELYEEIVKLRPEWHDKDSNKGAIKVVMTSTSSDPENWQIHSTTKQDRKSIGDRFKDESDELKLVIVRDMWLTGFDVPCLHTMYVDKPMRGHNLMQAIARVNRVFKDKPGGLVVDYLGIGDSLKQALSDYTKKDQEETGADQEVAVELMMDKLDVGRN